MKTRIIYAAALAAALTGCAPPPEEAADKRPTLIGYMFNPSNGDAIHLNSNSCNDTTLVDLGYALRFYAKDRTGSVYFGCYRVEEMAIVIRYDDDVKAARRLPIGALVLSDEYREWLARQSANAEESGEATP